MYAMFGFLLFNFMLMACVIALLAIVQIYMQLTYGNYEWWWRTFFIGASGGVYVAIYSVVYMINNFDLIGPSLWESNFIYLFYVYMFTFIYSVMCGSIAVMAGFVFVESIYSSIKFD